MKVNFLVDFNKSDNNGIINSVYRLADGLEKKGLSVSVNGGGYDYDIIHTHTPSPLHIFKVNKARKLGLKIVSHAHTTAEDVRGSFIFTRNKTVLKQINRYLRYFYSHADIILAPSEWTKNMLIDKRLDVPIEVLSNGINLKKFKFNQNSAKGFREKYGLEKDDIMVYSVGIVFLRKGIETFRKVAEELPDIKFFWIGKKYNSMYIDIRAINKVFKNLPTNLNFLGYINGKDVVGAHCAGDVFLFPSYVENQGIAILEAAACSRAIVLRNLPVYDWAEHKKNCLIAENDVEFVKNVESLSKDKRLRDRIGKAAKKVAEENDMEKTIERLISIYENLLSS